MRLLLLHLPVDWQVSLRLHSCPAPRTTLQRGPVRRRFGHSCVCHVEAANRSEVFLIHCSIWIYVVFCVLPKTVKQCIIILICNILFPNYIYFKFVICNSRLKLISLTKIENQIEKELCQTVASVHLPHLQVGFITLNRRNIRGSYLVQILHMTFLEVMTLIWQIWFEVKLKRLTHKLSKIDLLPQSYSKNLLKLMIRCSIEKKRIINAVSTFKYLSGLNLRY